MAVDHLSFTEAVERLAARVGVTLRYEEGGGPDRAEAGARQRLLDANAAAEAFFHAQLATPAARIGRDFLLERGFDSTVAEQYMIGYAPPGWDVLVHHLRGRGFTDDEQSAAGLTSPGRSGPIDRFRGRLVWPIRDLTGVTVGFGARRLADDDNGPKYLNTPQTRLYNKSAVLYGVDLAKREIAKRRQVVVVEGYTDVMAMHLSGVPTAVATCGTAFGAEHIKIVRRLIMDDDTRAGEIVFTFDGDEAGRKAALKAFGEDQRFVAQTFVAVEPGGRDPCELRQAGGPQAVEALVGSKRPLFEFVIRTTLAGLDLNRAEARVQGLRAAAPLVAQIRDPALRPEYARRLAGWLGMDVDEVRAAVAAAARRTARPATAGAQGDHPVDGAAGGEPPGPQLPRPDPRDPLVAAERQLLQMLLQFPGQVPAQPYADLGAGWPATPAYRVIDDTVRACGGPEHAGPDWIDRVLQTAPPIVAPLIRELAVAALPEHRPEHLPTLAVDLVRDARGRQLVRRRAELYGRLQRAESSGDTAELAAVNAELMSVQRAEHDLRGR
jgi:DNA primase